MQNRVHLDLSASDPEAEVEVERLVALGASVVADTTAEFAGCADVWLLSAHAIASMLTASPP